MLFETAEVGCNTFDSQAELEKLLTSPIESVTVDGTTVNARSAADYLELLRAMKSDCAITNGHTGIRVQKVRTQGGVGAQ